MKNTINQYAGLGFKPIYLNVIGAQAMNKYSKFVRYYPGRTFNNTIAAGRSQDGSTDKVLNEYNEKLGGKLKGFKDRDTAELDSSQLYEKAKNEFSKSKNFQELEEKRDALIQEERSASSKYIEEVKDDRAELFRELDKSKQYTNNSIDQMKKEYAEDTAQVMKEEGFGLIEREKLINKSFHEIKDENYPSDDEMSSVASFGSSDKSVGQKSEVDPQDNSGSNNQSPLDYVLEKKSTEPTPITELDGEE